MHYSRTSGKVGFGFLIACVLVGAGTGVYFGYYLPNHRFAAEQQRRIEALQKMVERLQSERRIAEVAVVQRSLDDAGRPLLTLRFVEFNRAGQEMPHKYFRVHGEEVYFDALVIKFQDDFVAAGDALRGQSIYLWRRVFGDQQPPETGELIDSAQFNPDGIPDVYRTGETISEYERQLWRKFWDYANDPAAAAREGVRVVQGEAVYTRMQNDRTYTLSIEADGGINIAPRALAPTTSP